MFSKNCSISSYYTIRLTIILLFQAMYLQVPIQCWNPKNNSTNSKLQWIFTKKPKIQVNSYQKSSENPNPVPMDPDQGEATPKDWSKLGKIPAMSVPLVLRSFSFKPSEWPSIMKQNIIAGIRKLRFDKKLKSAKLKMLTDGIKWFLSLLGLWLCASS